MTRRGWSSKSRQGQRTTKWRFERTGGTFHGSSTDRRSVATTATSLLRSDATYLLTGGLGGVGLAMAGWLAEKGAKHLLLLGRTGLPPRDEWNRLDPATPAGRRAAALLSIESLGTSVEARAVDVADAAALQGCLDEWAASGRPSVRGVIHAAGVLQFQPLESQDVASLRACLAGKVHGAWHLHRLLGRQLDFFVLCSSTSALLNSPLLGGYGAANAFLDALAWHRRGAGLPALSVNWGTWGEVGMAVDSGRGADMLSGVGTIPTATGAGGARRTARRRRRPGGADAGRLAKVCQRVPCLHRGSVLRRPR